MNKLVPEDYARLTRFSSLVLSAGGDAAWVRCFWQDGAWQRRVEVCSQGQNRIVSLGGVSEKAPAFSKDEQTLWFLSDGRIAVYSMSGQQAYEAFTLPDGLEATDVIPLSRGCLFSCKKEITEAPPAGCDWEMPRVTETLHFRNDADHGFTRKYIWRLCRYDGEIKLLSESEQPFRCLAVLPDESAALYAGKGFRLLSLADGKEQALSSPFSPAGDFRPLISPDGAWALAAVRTDGPEVTLRRLWLDGQEHEPDEPAGEPAGLPEGVYIDTSPERRSLFAPSGTPDVYYACFSAEHAPRLWKVTLSPGRILWDKMDVPGLITETAGAFGGRILVMCGDMSAPPQPAWIDGNTHTFLSPETNAWLSGMDIAPCQPLSVPSQDGRAELSGYLLFPSARAEKIPLLLWVHGGPSGCWAPGFNLEVQCALSEGFAVLLPNPRGSTGRGNVYASAEHAFDGGAANDILCLLDEALRRYPCLDQSRVSVLGGSYGGYMAAWLTGTTARFRSAVVLKGVTNWLFIHFNSSQAGQPIFDDYRDFQDFLVDTVKTSPVYYAQDVNAPTLIIHGEKDQQVPVENAHQYYTALKDCHPDLPVRLMLVPDACHSYTRDALPDYLAIQRETLGWLNLYGKGDAL